MRSSRTTSPSWQSGSERAGLTYSIPPRKVYSSVGIRVSECDEVLRQLAAFPKPCGILTYDDGIGRDILDLCRLLTTTDDSIAEIIASCGFGSLSRAKIAFRKRFGMSMRDYRRREKVSRLFA